MEFHSTFFDFFRPSFNLEKSMFYNDFMGFCAFSLDLFRLFSTFFDFILFSFDFFHFLSTFLFKNASTFLRRCADWLAGNNNFAHPPSAGGIPDGD